MTESHLQLSLMFGHRATDALARLVRGYTEIVSKSEDLVDLGFRGSGGPSP